MIRQARLREEYATWYSTIPPAGDNSPKHSAALCSANFDTGVPGRPAPARSRRHFEFQGGSAAGPPQASDVERRRMVPRVTPRQGSTDAVEGSH